jgi:hypothetical protein
MPGAAILRHMPSIEEFQALKGADVAVQLTESAGGQSVAGRMVGTLDAADGMVVFIEPADQPGARLSYNHQHIAAIARR